jgi:hypothetical protein
MTAGCPSNPTAFHGPGREEVSPFPLYEATGTAAVCPRLRAVSTSSMRP